VKARSWLLLLVFVLFVSGVWLVSKDYRTSPEEGKAAPDFTLSDRTHRKVSLTDYRGSVVLLNFWATWCGPCVAEMGSLEKLRQQLQGRPFEILAVSIDEEGWKAIDNFLKKIPVTFPILLDQDFSISDRYGTYRVPETYLIDPQGHIVEKILGGQDWVSPEMMEKIRKILPTTH
jgi:peroxiredoxin